MSHVRTVKSFPVMVYGTLSVDNFITAIPIYISYTQVVISLSGVSFVSRSVAVEYPMLTELFPVPIVCGQDGAGVISSAHYYARMYSVQVSDACQKTVAAVGAVISPTSKVATLGYIIDCLHGFSGEPVKNSQIFRAA